jgi:hypothetical protein
LPRCVGVVKLGGPAAPLRRRDVHFQETFVADPSTPRAGSPVTRRRPLLAFLAVLVIAALWAAVAPAERSMGNAIRFVYLHVSATWAGVTFLYGVGALGVVAVARPDASFTAWLRRGWTAGLVVFVLGFLLSLVSARVSWGGIFWAEPRMRASLGVVALGSVALAVDAGLPEGRGRGLVWTVAAAASFVLLRGAALYIHPEHPIQATTPWSIKGTFFGMFVLLLAGTAMLTLAFPPARGGEAGSTAPE